MQPRLNIQRSKLDTWSISNPQNSTLPAFDQTEKPAMILLKNIYCDHGVILKKKFFQNRHISLYCRCCHYWCHYRHSDYK